MMSNLILLYLEKDAWYDFNFFFNLPRLDLLTKMWSILNNVLCVHEKKVYYAAFDVMS